ncbi:MAG: hypothetical protein ABIG45_07710 [Bacillota bacterium]
MPYVMPMRCDAMVYLSHDLEYEPMVRYIALKARTEQVKITFLELLIAAYVRAISQVPEINRFIINKQYYNRTELTCSMVVLMDTQDGSVKENTIKIKFDPSDTIFDVQARVTKKVEENRKDEMSSSVIKIAKFVLKVPGLTSVIVWLLRCLDRYGILPGFLIDELPFHAGLWLTNNASIGLKSVYHHIYNFGNSSLFFAIGTPDRGFTINAKGNPIRYATIPVGITVDERVCAGATFAKLFTIMKKCLKNPEMLETPPETVYYNDGAEYHEPKPEIRKMQA